MRKLTHKEISLRRFLPETLSELPRIPVDAVLDNIRSLYNVGSIFRTADGARIGKLWLTGLTPYPPRKEIEKTALGSTGTVPWEYHRNPVDTIKAIRSRGHRLILLEQTDRSVPYFDVPRGDMPLSFVVGNEISGVSPEYLAAADGAIDIPMIGMKQSLNAAVAFGIVAFHFARIAGALDNPRGGRI